MELSFMLLQKIITLLLIVFMGFISVKQKRLNPDHSSTLSRICIEWICPCSIINAFLTTNADDAMGSFLFIMVVTFFVVIFYMGFTFLIRKPFRLNAPEVGSLMFTNSAAMTLPLAAALLGQGSIIYCTPHMCIQNLFIYTVLPVIMGAKQSGNILKVILNRNIVAVFIGFGLFMMKIQLPSIIQNCISTVGGSITVFYMIMIGMLMGSVNFRELLTNKKLYLVSLARLVAYPMILILVLKITGLPKLMPSASMGLIILVMCTASPVATAITQMADLYAPRDEAQEAGSINIISTLMCCITLPIMVFIYQWMMG